MGGCRSAPHDRYACGRWSLSGRSPDRIVKRSKRYGRHPRRSGSSAPSPTPSRGRGVPGRQRHCWAVYADEAPVGFVMIADEVDGPDYIPQFLWKLLIDERYQRRGLGTATLDLVVEYFRGRPGVEVITTAPARVRAARSRSTRATASCEPARFRRRGAAQACDRLRAASPQAARTCSSVPDRCSGITRTSASTGMKFVSPFQRGTTCRCRCPSTPRRQRGQVHAGVEAVRRIDASAPRSPLVEQLPQLGPLVARRARRAGRRGGRARPSGGRWRRGRG